MRVRRRFGFGARMPREPVQWDRFLTTEQSAVNVKDATGAVVVFDPTSVVAGAIDTRLTVMRLIMDVRWKLVFGAAPGAGELIAVDQGIALVDAGGAPNPALATSGSRVDWLWLSNGFFIGDGTSTVVAPVDETWNIHNDKNLLDLRVKRKLLETQQLVWSIRVTSQAIGTHTAFASTIVVHSQHAVSVLYQRTLRRR